MIYRTVSGVRAPALGFGTYHLRGDEGITAIRHALDVGYRLIDTAARYENEAEVGAAIAASGIDRSEIFLATKLRYTDLEPAGIEQRTRESLNRLGVDYVDLLMPHWPSPTIPIAAVMAAFAAMRDKGYTRHVGVSNFPIRHMREALAAFPGPILANQIEYHPFLRQTALLDLARATGSLITAAVPLARGAIEHEPVLRAIAEAHGKTVGQVTLRWLVQQDIVVAIPKSARFERIRQNFEIFDFHLSEDEMARIDALGGDRRLVDPPWAPPWDPPG